MSIALQFLIGGGLFLATLRLFGITGIIVLAVLLFGLELIHDLRLYRRPRHG